MLCVTRRSHETWLAELVKHGRRRLITWSLLSLAFGLSVGCGRVTTPGDATGTERGGNRSPMSESPALSPMPDGAPMDTTPDSDDDAQGRVCETNAIAGLALTIEGPDFECDELEVVASAPSYASDYDEELSCTFVSDVCRCFGAHERPGLYRVTVVGGEPSAELARSSLITVEEDDRGCHVETENVTLTLGLAPPVVDGGAVEAGAGGIDGGARDGGR